MPNMDQTVQMHEAPVPAQGLRSRFQCILSALIICFWIGLIDWRVLVTGLLMLYILNPFTINSSRLDVTVAVQNGKYIPEDVTTGTDTPGGIRQRPLKALEQGPDEPLAMVPPQQAASEGQSSNQSEVPERASSAGNPSVEETISGQNSAEVENDTVGQTEEPTDVQVSMENDNALEKEPETEPKTIESPTDGQTSIGADNEDSPQVQPETIDNPTDDHTSVGTKNDEVVRIEPETIKTSTDGHVSHDAEGHADPQKLQEVMEALYDAEKHANPRKTREIMEKLHYSRISEEQKNSRAFKLESRAIGSLVDCCGFDEEEDEENRLIANKLDDFLTRSITVMANWRETSAKQTNSDGLVSASNDQTTTTSMMRKRARARNSNAHHLVRPTVRGMQKSHAARARTLRLKATEEKARIRHSLANQQAGAGSVVDAEGGMVGLEVQEQVMERVEDGQSTDAVTSRHATVENAAEVDQVMNDREVEEKAGDGDEELPDADSTENVEVDEVMIGSDVEAEMEVDEQTPNSDGDSKCVDGEPMELEKESPRSEAKEADNPDSMEIEHQSRRGNVNKENLQDRIRREKAEIVLRQTSKKETSNGEIVSASISALVQSSRQHAAPVSVSESRDAAISVWEGVVQNMKSTNRAADLREARLGKKAEPKTVPEEVESQSPSPGVPVTEERTPESTPSTPLSKSLPEGMTTEGGNISESEQSITTPASTSPSTVLSSPPTSPSPRDMASVNGSPKPASANSEASTPGRQNCKRGSDSLDDSSDNENSSGELEKVKGNQSEQRMPGSGSTQISATRRVLLAKPVKRRVRIGHTEVSKVDDHQQVPGSASPSSQPTENVSAESKKARNTPKDDAGSELVVAPLTDIPDDRGQLEYTSQLLEVAGSQWEESGFDDSSDDDDDDGHHHEHN